MAAGCSSCAPGLTHSLLPSRYFGPGAGVVAPRGQEELLGHMHVRARASRLAPGLLLALAWCLLAPGTAPARGAASAPPRQAAQGARYVLPFPGTLDASPSTQIDFGAVRPSELESIKVMGSSSGPHEGLLKPMPNADGTAFIPNRAFTAGEHVSVAATVGGRGAQTRNVSFGFSVAAPAAPAAGPSSTTNAPDRRAPQAHAAQSATAKTQSFHSEPWLRPPILLTSGRVPDPRQGDFFADAEDSIQAGPLIYSPSGGLVWFDPQHKAAAFNVEVQNYLGQSVLTFWRGYVSSGVGIGSDMILDHTYQTIATVNAANGYFADLHEFQITPDGNALITAYTPVHADLRSVGGPANGTLLDSIVQEIDIATGQLLWEWHAYAHVHIAESFAGKPGASPYDFFHINSVEELANGNFIVSARDTSAVYEIDRATGRILWVLGGKHSSFALEKGTRFWWQHDGRLRPGNVVTVFDDGEGMRVMSEKQSRGLQIRLNFKRHRATLVRAYPLIPPVLAGSQGNVQPLPDGNTVVGYGSAQYFSEFDRRGHQRFSARFYAPIGSYRDYRFPWYGEPTGSPYAAAAATRSGTTVYASWNGATDVATWRVLAGPAPSALAPVAQGSFTGFESALATNSKQPYFAVQALGSGGQLLGTSAVVGR